MVWSNNSQVSTWTPCDGRTGVVWGPRGNLQCFPYLTGPVRDQYGARKGAVLHSYGNVRELTQPGFANIPHGRRMWSYGARTLPALSAHGQFTGCLQYLNPYVTRNRIMLALKLPERGGKIRTAPGHVSEHTIFAQNSLGTARTGPRIDVTQALPWWLPLLLVIEHWWMACI